MAVAIEIFTNKGYSSKVDTSTKANLEKEEKAGFSSANPYLNTNPNFPSASNSIVINKSTSSRHSSGGGATQNDQPVQNPPLETPIAPRQQSYQETSSISSPISNVPYPSTQSYGGTISSLEPQTAKGTEFIGMRYSERGFYIAGETATNLQSSGNQFKYVAGAGLGVAVGVGRFVKDIGYDIIGQGGSEIPLSRTAKSTYSAVSDPISTIKDVGTQFRSNLFESIGYYGAPTILSKVIPPVREGFIRSSASKVNAIDYLNPEALQKVEAGGKSYPPTTSINKLYSDFQKYISPEGNIKVVSASPSPLTSYGQSRIIKIGEGSRGKANIESTGKYVTFMGEGNPSFFRITKSSEYSGLSFFPKMSRPTLSVTDVPSDVFGRIPNDILKRGVGAENTYLRANPGRLFITGNVERAFNNKLIGRATTEPEAIITPGSIEVSTGGVLGYKQYFDVSGRAIPIRTYKLQSSSKEFNILKSTANNDGFNYNPKTNTYEYISRPSFSVSKFILPSYYNKPISSSSSFFKPSSSRSSFNSSSNSIYPSSSYSIILYGSSKRSIGSIPKYSSLASYGNNSLLVSPKYSVNRKDYKNMEYNFNPDQLSKRKDDYFLKKRKPTNTKIINLRYSKSNVYILPDLASVSKTEAKNYARFGFGEAIAPKATKRVKELSFNAFYGKSSGFVPTEQMRRKI